MVIRVNRAPVLTLWAAVVAERLGYSWDEALTLGRVVAGLNAYSKGKALGLYAPKPESVKEHRSKLEPGSVVNIDLLHRAVPAVRTARGLRAVSKDQPVEPEGVERYLESKFKDGLPEVRAAHSSRRARLGRRRGPGSGPHPFARTRTVSPVDLVQPGPRACGADTDIFLEERIR